MAKICGFFISPNRLGSSIVRECVKTLKVNTNLALTTEYDVCIINQSEAFQKRERGKIIPEVSFNVSDKALHIQEAKSKVHTLPCMYTLTMFCWYYRIFCFSIRFITFLTVRMRRVKGTTSLPTLLASLAQKLKHAMSWRLTIWYAYSSSYQLMYVHNKNLMTLLGKRNGGYTGTSIRFSLQKVSGS